MLENLKHQVCKASLKLVEQDLVIYTWGNVSTSDRASGLVVIKPSGISYEEMIPANEHRTGREKSRMAYRTLVLKNVNPVEKEFLDHHFFK